jgi:hypothetical protein
MTNRMRERESEETRDDREHADQWSAGGTLPDVDATWPVPPDDPDATWPLERRGAAGS